MADFILVASPFVAAVFFVNLVKLLKNIHAQKDTGANTVVGALTIFFLTFAMLAAAASR